MCTITRRLDILGTLASVFFNYASPFFLRRILEAIDHPTPAARARAYVYAFLAFLATVGKAQADLQHLWYGRRAATRIKSELMAAIYDKALKRRDYSGIVDKDKLKEKKGETKDKKAEETKDDPKAGADVGKIVNLMAGDANRIAMTTSAMYFLYGSKWSQFLYSICAHARLGPFEIVIASVFLYQ